MKIDLENKLITLPTGTTVGKFLKMLEHVNDVDDFVINQELPLIAGTWAVEDNTLWTGPQTTMDGHSITITNSPNSACEGCPQYEKIKRGETVICNCTIPSNNVTYTIK